MPSTDITYCIRDCGNMECKRNKQHLPYENKEVWMSFFKACKEWKPDGYDN